MSNELIQIPVDVLDRIEAIRGLTKIETADQAETVTDGLNICAHQLKRIETWRVERKAPVLELGKKIDADAKGMAARFEEADKLFRGILKAYQLEQKRLADAENERIRIANLEAERIAKEAEQAKIDLAAEEARQLAELLGDDPDAAAEEARAEAAAPTLFNPPEVVKEIPLAVPRGTVGNYGSAGLRMVWKAEIVDDKLVPREYMTVNMVAVNAAVKAGVRDIPGVKIYEDATISVRG